jgi:Subtilisin inhibitor-like
VLLVAAGCGTGEASRSQPAEPRSDMVVTFWATGRDGPERNVMLTCDPDGGTHPDPVKACAALRSHPEALHPVPLDMACTQIYGGDQVARIGGADIQAVFDRTNGCEIARWDALAPVLELG